MTSDIRKLLTAQPFLPFAIHTADGREYAVPTPDYAHVVPNGRRVSIFSEDGFECTLSANGLKVQANGREATS